MKKQTILTAILAVVGVAVIGVGAYFVYRTTTTKDNGTITVKVIELNDVLVKEKDIPFVKGDSLVNLVQDNFSNVTINDGMIMSIESLTTPSDWSTYICIYKNGEMSAVGIKEIQFTTGDVISFVNTTFSM